MEENTRENTREDRKEKRQNGNTSSGFITIDFLFSMIVAFGLSAILFAMGYTLTVVEVTQYIMYSTTRTYIAAHRNYSDQEKAAKDKYNSLVTKPPFGGLYQNGWFEIASASQLDMRGGPSGNERDFNAPFDGSNDRNWFLGISTFFTASVLNLKIPYMGSSSDEGNDGFKTRVNVFLIREPSTDECMEYIKNRSEHLSKLKPFRMFESPAREFLSKTYKSMEDNGC